MRGRSLLSDRHRRAATRRRHGARFQREDWRAAIDHARGLHQVDSQPVALWGSSFSGGHVLAEAAPAGVQVRLLLAAVRDAVHGLLRLPPVLVPVVAPFGQIATMTEPEANTLITTPLVAGTTWRNEFALDVAAKAPRAETRIYPVGHFGLYHGTGFTQAVADQIGFLSRHLGI